MLQPSLRTEGLAPGATVCDRGLCSYAIAVIVCCYRGLSLVAACVRYVAAFLCPAIHIGELRTITWVNTSHLGIQSLAIARALVV